jgi:predicted RND superfamily exporter protein
MRKIKRRRRKRDTAANLRQRVQQQFPDQEVVVGEARDGVKMSQVLEEFIALYREFADTEEAFRKLLVTAVVAWNTALFPAKERETHIEEVLKALPKEVRADGKAIINELMERKERHFSEYRRMIIDYEVTDTGKDYHLTVISTADELEEQ